VGGGIFEKPWEVVPGELCPMCKLITGNITAKELLCQRHNTTEFMRIYSERIITILIRMTLRP
jgi:hypothetical protein